MIVADRYTLAGEQAKGHLVEDMPHEENDAFAATSELTLLFKEVLEVALRKGLGGNAIGLPCIKRARETVTTP